MATERGYWSDPVDHPWLPDSTLERVLWAVVALSLVGDVVTTWVGLSLVGLSEANPVARGAIDTYGFVGMAALKGVALVLALGCRAVIADEYGAVVPAGLAFPWTAAVCVNLYAISLAV